MGHKCCMWYNLLVHSESVCSGKSVYGSITCGSVSLTDSDAKTTLELVLAVVEEGAEDQRERQREQLLF